MDIYTRKCHGLRYACCQSSTIYSSSKKWRLTTRTNPKSQVKYSTREHTVIPYLSFGGTMLRILLRVRVTPRTVRRPSHGICTTISPVQHYGLHRLDHPLLPLLQVNAARCGLSCDSQSDCRGTPMNNGRDNHPETTKWCNLTTILNVAFIMYHYYIIIFF